MHFDLTLNIKKNVFLITKANNQAFINLLANILSGGGVSVIYAQGVKDVLITRTGLSKAAKLRTVVVGNDTNLLVLLLYLAKKKIRAYHEYYLVYITDIRK